MRADCGIWLCGWLNACCLTIGPIVEDRLQGEKGSHQIVETRSLAAEDRKWSKAVKNELSPAGLCKTAYRRVLCWPFLKEDYHV